MLEWLKEHNSLLWVLGICSLAVLAATLFVIPAIVVRMPADYFAHERRPRSRLDGHRPGLRLALRIGKNVLGAVLMLAGLAMLLLPGQGLLTLLVGFFLIDGPGKYRAERWLVAQRWVSRPINWMRRKRGKEPLKVRSRAPA